jgi:hypothetical protein
MTHPTPPKRYNISINAIILPKEFCPLDTGQIYEYADGHLVLHKEALAAIKQARMDALEDVLDICTKEGGLRSSSHEFNDVITKIRKLKEGV